MWTTRIVGLDEWKSSGSDYSVETPGLRSLDDHTIQIGRSPPFVDLLEIHFIAESSARLNSFTKGDEVQYLYLPNEYVDQVLASKRPVTLQPAYAEKYAYSGPCQPPVPDHVGP